MYGHTLYICFYVSIDVSFNSRYSISSAAFELAIAGMAKRRDASFLKTTYLVNKKIPEHRFCYATKPIMKLYSLQISICITCMCYIFDFESPIGKTKYILYICQKSIVASARSFTLLGRVPVNDIFYINGFSQIF